MVCSLWRHSAGVITHRLYVASKADIRFDGDVVSYTAVYTENAKAEVQKLLNSRNYYVAPNGKMTYSVMDNITSYVLSYITG